MKLHLIDPLALDNRLGWLSLLPSFAGDGDGGGSDGDGDGSDGDDDDESDDDESDEDDDDSKDDEDKKTAADTEKRLKTLERSLRRARAESKKWKNLANSNAGNKKDDEGDSGPDFRAAAMMQAGVNALVNAGFTGKSSRAERLLALVNLDDIEPDSRGRFDPDDFEDAIEEIREEYPELFRSEDDDDTESRRRPASRVNRSGGSSSAGPKKLTSDQKFALAIAGQAGYRGLERRIREGR